MNPIKEAIRIVGGPTKLARELSVSTQAVCFWRDGKRSIPVDKMYEIEQATNGAVTRKDMRVDDWQRIWPELADKQTQGD